MWDVRKKLGIVSYDLQRDYLICAEGRNVVLSGFYASNDTYDHQTFTRDQVSRADAVMRELGIESFATRVFGQLSTGEQRRFLLGRALVHDPPVLVSWMNRPAGSISNPASSTWTSCAHRFIKARPLCL
jgi:iron complex transport system ATP-binding protein